MKTLLHTFTHILSVTGKERHRRIKIGRSLQASMSINEEKE